MIKKISTFAVFVLVVTLVLSFTLSNGNDRRSREMPVVTITGDEPSAPSNYTVNLDSRTPVNYTTYYSDSVTTITDVYTGEESLYDLQSNGSTQHCWQDPSNPDNIHLGFIWNQTAGFPAANRRTKYVFSDDRGVTWTSLGEVPNGASAGFIALHGLADGRAVIGNHSSPTGVVRGHIYVDISPGGGSFTACDPGTDGVLEKIWLRLTTVASNRVVFIGSKNTAADSLAYTNALTNLTNCTFSGYVGNTDIDNAEQYAIATSDNGSTIGLAYIRNGNNTANMADVRYISSTDGGLTWSAPVTIFDAQPDPNQFIGGLRGVDLVFSNNQPRVVFDLVWQTDAGSYFPGLCSRIMYWSPSVNGGTPVVVADSTNTPCNPSGGINDVFTPLCRATIGKTNENSALFVAYNVARADIWPSDSTNYYDIYLAWSINNGTSWSGRKRLTNRSGPLRDCRYPSIAPVNVRATTGDYAYIEYQNDSVPGSHVNGAGASLAEQHFITAKFLPGAIGIQNLGSEVPKTYALHQNYPNPFNPSTTIRFELPKAEKVTIKIFDVQGKLVATLVNEVVSAGVKEFEFNASNLPSGVYFYTIKAGDFTDSKKMVLVK